MLKLLKQKSCRFANKNYILPHYHVLVSRLDDDDGSTESQIEFIVISHNLMTKDDDDDGL